MDYPIRVMDFGASASSDLSNCGIKLVGRSQCQERPVFNAIPLHEGDRINIMSEKKRPQTVGKVFVEE